MRVERVYLDGIELGERLRPLVPERVAAMKSSIMELGLRTPLTVMAKPNGDDTRMILVAGHHRLAALMELGEEAAPCFVMPDDDIDARLWEIAENLYRADLSKDQRDEHIRLYAGLLAKKESQDGATEVSRQIEAKPQGGRPKGVASRVAEQTGISKSTVERALNPQRVADERARSKIDADVKDRATREAAEIIAQYVPAEAWDGLKANLYASGAKHLADALTNITGNSVMDRGGWQ